MANKDRGQVLDVIKQMEKRLAERSSEFSLKESQKLKNKIALMRQGIQDEAAQDLGKQYGKTSKKATNVFKRTGAETVQDQISARKKALSKLRGGLKDVAAKKAAEGAVSKTTSKAISGLAKRGGKKIVSALPIVGTLAGVASALKTGDVSAALPLGAEINPLGGEGLSSPDLSNGDLIQKGLEDSIRQKNLSGEPFSEKEKAFAKYRNIALPPREEEEDPRLQKLRQLARRR